MNKKELIDWLWKSFEGVLHRSCKHVDPKNILEWGPGHSTDVMSKASPNAKILSIEHKPDYLKIARKRFGSNPNIRIEHKPLSMKGGASEGYITYPMYKSIQENGEIVREYDLIFVDGRSRFDCTIVGQQLLKKGGVLIMHDTHRTNYHPAIKSFPHFKFYPNLRTAVASFEPLDWLGDEESVKDIPVEVVAKAPNKVLSYEETISDLRSRFISGDPFFYTRFGDADLFFIEDPNFSKNKRHDPAPGLGKELGEAFAIDHPDFLIGCAAGGRVFGGSKGKLLVDIAGRHHEGKVYHSAVAIHDSYIKDFDEYESFMRDCLHPKKVLLVGGESVCRNPLVREVLGVDGVIELSDRNAYQMLDSKMAQIEKNVPKYDIMVSALGQATRVLAKRLWEKNLRDIQYFDVGSSIDALAERPLRSWIRRYPDHVLEYKKRFPLS